MNKSNYDDFLLQYEVYETFAYECFKAYTKGWNGYPGIENISFNKNGIELVYSVYEDKENLHIPIEFAKSFDISGVVNLWRKNKLDEQKQREENAREQQKRRDLEEFERLKVKLNK